MTNYDVYTFDNGRVALIDSKILSEAIEQDKEVLIVCNSWSGGYAYATGANKIVDPNFGDCWEMYGYEVREEEFDSESLQKFYKVIFTPGEMIYMETGDQANSYQGGQFIDWHSKEDEIHRRHNIWPQNGDKSLTFDEIFKMRKTVNECLTVRHLYKDVEAKVNALISRGILSKDATKWI